MSTKTIDATNLRNNLSATLQGMGNDDVIFIRNRGKLTGKTIIDDELLEDLLSLADNDYLNDIKKSREQIKKGDTYSFDEVFGDVL